MSPLADHVLPYLKAAVEDDGRSEVELDEKDFPVFVPFVGSLHVSYVVDEGQHFRFVTEGERESLGLSQADLRSAAIVNLQAKIGSTGVRLVPHGKCLAVLFGGNFEATLLLWEDLITHAQKQLGPDLLAAAPARDVLTLSSPAGVDELRAGIARIWPGGDHLLTQDLYRHTERGWSVYQPS